MIKPRILFSVPTVHHVEIAIDEVTGLQQLGYSCATFPYAAKKGFDTKLGRLKVIIQNAFGLVKIAREFSPDIIYLNSRLEVVAGVRDFITIRIFKFFYRQKVQFVIKSHGSDIEVLHRRGLLSRLIFSYLRRTIAAWLFLSNEEKELIIKTGYFYSDRIFITKNIVRTEQFQLDSNFRERMNIAPDAKILLFVGRIIREKGIFEVIGAFARIVKKHNALLIINGEGPEFGNIKKLIDSYGLADKVICTGFIAESDVVQFYANSNVLVFPTYFPEGFPMALFNAVSAGLSIVTTKTRAAVDYLSEPENCLWVRPQDPEDVRNALDKLLGSTVLMADMRAQNLNKGTEFSQARVCAELSENIQTIFDR